MTVETGLPAPLLAPNLLFPGKPPRFQNLAHSRNAAELYPQFVMAHMELTEALHPAEPNEIAVELEVMRARYPAFAADPVQQIADTLEDEWFADLSSYPLWAIRKARENWRHKDTAFSPRSVGQLMASVHADVSRMRTYLRRAGDAMKACEALETAA